MSEDVTVQLSRFTPTGLDRDAVLYAAGNAAGRQAVWKWLAAALAVSNAATLAVFLWPRPPAPPLVAPVPDRTAAPLTPPPAVNLSADDLPPLADGAVGLIPDQPPLIAGQLSLADSTLYRDSP